ncbi:MAG: hypothetical protein INR73_02465 [Williamsia sp.]|nr:hypothetical protein [Williamsia sp.]
MGLFDFFKKSPAPKQPAQTIPAGPYRDNSTNFLYNLLFCDNLDLYKANAQLPSYPFDILFSESSSPADLQKIIDDATADPRIKVLAYNKQLALGQTPAKKELLAVIVEVGLDGGLDVLASFNNGTARYINQTGKVLIWETTEDTTANGLTNELFARSAQIIDQIGPWDKPRKPHPAGGNARISFLVSDGLYFGEAPVDTLFNDPLARAALQSATKLMQYLTHKSLEKSPNP